MAFVMQNLRIRSVPSASIFELSKKWSRHAVRLARQYLYFRHFIEGSLFPIAGSGIVLPSCHQDWASFPLPVPFRGGLARHIRASPFDIRPIPPSTSLSELAIQRDSSRIMASNMVPQVRPRCLPVVALETSITVFGANSAHDQLIHGLVSRRSCLSSKHSSRSATG